MAKRDKKKKVIEGRPRRSEGVPRLRERYLKEITPAMVKHFSYSSVMQVPRIEKIVLNMGVGIASRDVKELDIALGELTQIAGQKPNIRRARKSVAGFKLREEMPIGCAVTLRGPRMYEFLDRLINVAIPRIRDFRGLNPKSFDGRGNHSMGVVEHLIFTELDSGNIGKTRGLDITTVTSAGTDEEALELLKRFGMPFK